MSYVVDRMAYDATLALTARPAVPPAAAPRAGLPAAGDDTGIPSAAARRCGAAATADAAHSMLNLDGPAGAVVVVAAEVVAAGAGADVDVPGVPERSECARDAV
jgi:hypothetical protein